MDIELESNSFNIRYGVTANITAFHAVARGSTPRIGIFSDPKIKKESIPSIKTKSNASITEAVFSSYYC